MRDVSTCVLAVLVYLHWVLSIILISSSCTQCVISIIRVLVCFRVVSCPGFSVVVFSSVSVFRNSASICWGVFVFVYLWVVHQCVCFQYLWVFWVNVYVFSNNLFLSTCDCQLCIVSTLCVLLCMIFSTDSTKYGLSLPMCCQSVFAFSSCVFSVGVCYRVFVFCVLCFQML